MDWPNTKPLVFKTGGKLVGVGFLLMGLTVTAGLIALAVTEEIPAQWIRILLFVLAAIPLAVAGLGFLLTFGGEHITIDRADRQVRIRYGRWWTWQRRAQPFDDFFCCRDPSPKHGDRST